MIESIIREHTLKALKELYALDVSLESLSVQKTRKEFEGDYTIVVFPFLKASRKNPESTAQDLGAYLTTQISEVTAFNIVKGFLNLTVSDDYWIKFLEDSAAKENYGGYECFFSQSYVIEYSSPNTNKPLHLGHIRNNLLGASVSDILSFAGHKVNKVNLVNDRGIHICKSMLARQKWGPDETPESTGLKGDHLVGKFYVMFEQELKKEKEALVNQGLTVDEAADKAPLMQEARQMLLAWEENDPQVRDLWKTMNQWVLNGFDMTYKKLGVGFDKTYFESETYLIGKKMVEDGLKGQVFFQKPDNSVWVDLSAEGLDEKLLLRADGTSVYMTQDLGTAILRTQDYHADKYVYVVGNEQNYHFDVLKHILKKMKVEGSEGLLHLSYGMVELPDGKMKSREGKVVDADDLVEEMIQTAQQHSEELGKVNEFSAEEAQKLYEILALGALKYFILKVDPKKNMVFNPQESIDFNGNTGPFIQYAYVRINSLLKKASQITLENEANKSASFDLVSQEKALLKLTHDFGAVVQESALNYSPALLANYLYEVAVAFNQFYHDLSVLKEPDLPKMAFRIRLSGLTGQVLKQGLKLLGIQVPDRM